MIKITIHGPPVTKKNSQRIFWSNGRPLIHPSKKFAEYQEAAGWYIPEKYRLRINRPVNVRCVYFMPTRRRVDLVNLLEASCDILVKYCVLEDDNSGIVVSHDGSRVLYDKENPRTEIEIEEVRGNAET